MPLLLLVRCLKVMVLPQSYWWYLPRSHLNKLSRCKIEDKYMACIPTQKVHFCLEDCMILKTLKFGMFGVLGQRD